MADIDIERKERSATPWILGVLAVILVLGALAYMFGTDDSDVATVTDPVQETMSPDVDPVSPPPEPTPGAEFGAWVRDSAEAMQQMGQEHEYTREGIQRMAAALENLVARDTAPEIRQRLQTLRQQATAIRESAAESPQHANQVKQAFTTAVEIMDNLRQREHLQQANLDEPVSGARSAADELSTDTALLEQRTVVHQFFERMSEAIERAERHIGR